MLQVMKQTSTNGPFLETWLIGKRAAATKDPSSGASTCVLSRGLELPGIPTLGTRLPLLASEGTHKYMRTPQTHAMRPAVF